MSIETHGMPETHYIEIDEEIIGAVSRLRRSITPENIFVFPKRALILQSIINLKLLAREAQKLGKVIIVMTQDQQGAQLAAKAGLRVQNYQDSSVRKYQPETTTRFTVRHGESIPMPERVDDPASLRRSDEIGSDQFMPGPQPNPHPVPIKSSPVVTALPTNEADRKKLRIRNASLPLQTALNSQQTVSLSDSSARPQPMSTPQSAHWKDTHSEPSQKERVRRFFDERHVNIQSAPRYPVVQPNIAPPIDQTPQRITHDQKMSSWISIAGASLVLVVTVIAGYFFLRPEAMITVEPQSATQTVKLPIVGTVDGGSGIALRLIEQEKTVQLSRTATGKDTISNAKASGTITIINAFGTDPQPLVATTRFETADGKIYRLVEGVTVPGMKSSLPGKIDARVMADSAGEEYNITSGTFTIPGFKGSPKYEKITAEIKGPQRGGGDSAVATLSTVSIEDLDAAKVSAADEARDAVFKESESSLSPGEILLQPSFQMSLLGTPSAPVIGTPAEQFDYEARFQVRGFVLSETAVRALIDKETAESDGVVLHPYRYDVRYSTALTNFESKRVDLTVESTVVFRAPLNEIGVKTGLLGLNEDGIRSYLTEHPEIKRLQVEFKPKMFVATIPRDPKRVTVNIMETE